MFAQNFPESTPAVSLAALLSEQTASSSPYFVLRALLIAPATTNDGDA
jgi:hypothetical protein